MASSTLTLTPDDALSVLEYWYTSAERLMLVYRRAEECVTRIGCGRVRNATAREVWMDTNHGRLHIMMHSAAFEFGTLARGAAACFHEIQADGLLICVDLDDWIFLRSAPARLLSRLWERIPDAYRPETLRYQPLEATVTQVRCGK
jgi:hypothetical protein